MKISPNIYMCAVPFFPGSASFVNLFLVTGRRAVLIDAGVSGAEPYIAAMLREAGLTFSELQETLISHAHPDHIGALRGLKRKYSLRVAASGKNREWIEDVYSQLVERPAPRFTELVEGSVGLDRTLEDGELIDLGGGSTLLVLETPGHCEGQLAFFHERDGALLTADAIPRPGKPPIYDDPLLSLKTLSRLQAAEGVRVLLSSWDEPHYGAEAIAAVYAEANEYIRTIDRLVSELAAVSPDLGAREAACRIYPALGLSESAFSPLAARTIAGHLNMLKQKGTTIW